MKEPLEIVIHKHGLKLCHPADNTIFQFIAKEEGPVAAKIAAFIKKTGAASSTLHLFVAEDLLFFKSFELPLDTLDLGEAVGFQMEMLTPFAEESTWHSFAANRSEGVYKVTLFAAQSRFIDIYVQEVIDAGYQISGLYPESQRFVNRLNRRGPWALLLPGRFVKAYLFNGPDMEDRLLCSAEPTFPEAVEVCHSEVVFRMDQEDEHASLGTAAMPSEKPYFDFIDARFLLPHRPNLKQYNMLPASYQRPDYSKLIIYVLLVLNLVTFLSLGVVKGYRLKTMDAQVDREIEKVMPMVNEMRELRAKEEEYLQALVRLEEVGTNFNFIEFLNRLTAEVPSTSYVDQMRMDKKNNSIHVQGYTEDINQLTSKLQNIGDAQLKSTSRRKNKTYFHVEISLP